MRKVFYYIKPLVPRNIQLYFRRQITEGKRRLNENLWPILPGSERKPENWSGWPDNKKFAFVLTHDVERQKGHDRVETLMEIEQQYGIVSSFNFVPERYNVSPELRKKITENGFEVGVHGLKHDGKLYNSRKIFLERAKKINVYLKDWNASGFRSPAMHHNLDWLRDLNIEYDSSTFDTDPFEPQPDNINSIFPLWVHPHRNRPGYVELPYTLPQDFTLFIIMREKNIDIWKKKLDWIAENNGMALVNVHPDYLNFYNRKAGAEEFPVKLYRDFLEYVQVKYENEFWQVTPLTAARFFRESVVNHQSGEKENLITSAQNKIVHK